MNAVPPDPFEERSRELFEDSVDRLDARTRSRLNQARQRALEELKKGSNRRYWLGAPLGALAAAAVVAVVLVRGGGEPALTGRDSTNFRFDDFDIVADTDNFEMLRDVEFYSWLAVEDDGPGNNRG